MIAEMGCLPCVAPYWKNEESISTMRTGLQSVPSSQYDSPLRGRGPTAGLRRHVRMDPENRRTSERWIWSTKSWKASILNMNPLRSPAVFRAACIWKECLGAVAKYKRILRIKPYDSLLSKPVCKELGPIFHKLGRVPWVCISKLQPPQKDLCPSAVAIKRKGFLIEHETSDPVSLSRMFPSRMRTAAQLYSRLVKHKWKQTIVAEGIPVSFNQNRGRRRWIYPERLCQFQLAKGNCIPILYACLVIREIPVAFTATQVC